MGKTRTLYLPMLLLAGCAQFPDLQTAFKSLEPTGMPEGSTPAEGQFHFDWALSGDRNIAPLQVFDDGRKVWLQFGPGSPVPALFARSLKQALQRGIAGDRLLTPRRQGDFLVIDELPALLVIRGGHLQALARRGGEDVSVADADEAPGHNDTGHPVAHGAPLPPPIPVPPPLPLASPPPKSPQQPPVSSLATQAMSLPASALSVEVMPVAPSGTDLGPASLPPLASAFVVGRSDGTLRQALVRWAAQAGWDFGPEHWMVDVDIPITGAASFEVPFVEAVQALVGSTELAVKPLQPCFYSNRVLRIVPYAQACDRTRAAVGQS